MSKTAMQELSELSPQLSLNILKDIDHRVSDWLARGGDENDPYIWQQVRYAKNYIAATFLWLGCIVLKESAENQQKNV